MVMKIAAVYTLAKDAPFKALVAGPMSEVFKLMSELGFDGVEINIPNPFDVDIRNLAKALSDYGLELSAISTGLSYLVYDLSLTHPNEEKRRKSLEFFMKYSEMSAELSNRGRVIIGLARGKCGNRPRDEVSRIFKESLRLLLEKTEDYGTIYLLEPINRYEIDFINTVDEALEYVREFNRVQLLLDTFHMTLEDESPYKAIEKAGKFIGYVHVAENNRLAPGMGMLDWERIICKLLISGYHGYLSIEAIPRPSYEEMLRVGIETLRKYIPKAR